MRFVNIVFSKSFRQTAQKLIVLKVENCRRGSLKSYRC